MHEAGTGASGFATIVGVVHAAVLVTVAVHLGYPFGPGKLTPTALAWHYGGLVVAAALPAYLALRYRLLAPAVLATATAAWVVHAELSPPGPTFLPLEGFLVVKDGLYVGGYATRWFAPTAAFLHAGAAEWAARRSYGGTTPVHDVRADWGGADGTRPGLAAVVVLAAAHGAIALAYGAGGGSVDPVAVAMAGPAGLVGYMAVRHGLVIPYLVFIGNVLAALHANAGLAGTDLTVVGAGPLVAVCLAAATVEGGLRSARRRLATWRSGTA